MWWPIIYVISLIVLVVSCGVIGYVWRIRHEYINEAVNSRLQEAIDIARQEMDRAGWDESDPFAWPTTLVSDHD